MCMLDSVLFCYYFRKINCTHYEVTGYWLLVTGHWESLLLLLLLLWHLVGARVVGLLATESCLLGSRVLPPITGAA